VCTGLWRPGKESLTKEAASDELVNELVARAGLRKKPGAKVLDVGCGVAGTTIKLSTDTQLAARMTGITISEKQVEIANANIQAAVGKGLYKASAAPLPRILLMNGEKINFPGEEGTFDCVWICEALSHFENKPAFFAHAHRMLAPGGKLVVADWFAADFVRKPADQETLRAIEYGMLLPKLDTKVSWRALTAVVYDLFCFCFIAKA
jgi:tocopherol O-methyltransferase